MVDINVNKILFKIYSNPENFEFCYHCSTNLSLVIHDHCTFLQINLEGLAVNTILHSHHVNDLEGVSTVSLDTVNKQVILCTFCLSVDVWFAQNNRKQRTIVLDFKLTKFKIL